MHTYRLHQEQWLPRAKDDVFAFFSDPRNLEALTPSLLRFEILTQGPIPMAEGTLIDYRIRVRSVPVRWRTAITVWEPGTRFVDEQLRGPYRLWRHEHRFEAKDGGTSCIDDVEYAVPGGPLFEGLVNKLFVRADLDTIFAFRRAQLEAWSSGAPIGRT